MSKLNNYTFIDLVSLANSLLARVPRATPISSFSQINAKFFVFLFEALFGETLPGSSLAVAVNTDPVSTSVFVFESADVIRSPKTKAEEAHNVQSAIDTLSLDIINTSLSHLRSDEAK